MIWIGFGGYLGYNEAPNKEKQGGSMGGFGSGKGSRYNKASTRRRQYVNGVPSIDIRSIHKPELDALNLLLEAPGLYSQVTLKRHKFKSGGVWHTFECPICRSGRFKLYLRFGSFGCHKCLNLAYRSENKGKADRAVRMKWKYIEQIAGKDSSDHPNRPNGMHRKTYDRLMSKIARYDSASTSLFFHC